MGRLYGGWASPAGLCDRRLRGAENYLWLAKRANTDPYYYAVALVLLMGVRARDWLRRRAVRRNRYLPGV